MNTIRKKYQDKIAEKLDAQAKSVFLYWKGRVGLYAILKAMKIQKGDEVIQQAFTCVVVPNAVIYAKATPVYVDIEKDTLNTSLKRINEKVTENTKCIIIQNTFGLSSEVEEIVAFAKEKGIYTIEDCTHGFGGTYNGKPNGTYCDAAFYSSQWNKPFSTGIGGMVLINNESLLKSINEVNKDLIQPSGFKNFQLSLLIKARKYLITGGTYWFLLKLYRFLSKKGWVIGSSDQKEITSIEMPENYFMDASKVQFKNGIKAIKKLDQQLKARKRNALNFHTFLKEKNKFHYPESTIENHSFLKYPIFVKNRSEFMEKAEKNKIPLGDWFESMLHPVNQDLSPWSLNENEFGNAREAAAHILNLPTDTNNPKKVLRFLEQNIGDLVEFNFQVRI